MPLNDPESLNQSLRPIASEDDPRPCPHCGQFTNAVRAQLAESRAMKLEQMIGHPPPGSPTEEWLPRAATWHQERLNWAKEVARLTRELQIHQAALRAFVGGA